MRCPTCHDDLTACIYEGASIHTCDGCGGEFIGSMEMAHIVDRREETFSAEIHSQLAEREPAFGVPEEQTERSLACPSCQNAMQVVNYSCDSGVFIDKCSTCGGVWLDQSELEKIQALMERWHDEAPEKLSGLSGQLEMARRQAAESTNNAFAGSRFSFVNALINRLMDAA